MKLINFLKYLDKYMNFLIVFIIFLYFYIILNADIVIKQGTVCLNNVKNIIY